MDGFFTVWNGFVTTNSILFEYYYPIVVPIYCTLDEWSLSLHHISDWPNLSV